MRSAIIDCVSISFTNWFCNSNTSVDRGTTGVVSDGKGRGGWQGVDVYGDGRGRCCGAGSDRSRCGDGVGCGHLGRDVFGVAVSETMIPRVGYIAVIAGSCGGESGAAAGADHVVAADGSGSRDRGVDGDGEGRC